MNGGFYYGINIRVSFVIGNNKIHNKSTYKIIKNNKCRNDPKNPNFIIYKTPK